MNLIVDVGNTRVKLALFEQGRLTEQCGAETLSAATLEGLLGGRRADRAVISSTRGPVPGIVELVRKFACGCSSSPQLPRADRQRPTLRLRRWGATGWLPPSVPPPSIRDAMR